ncbi:MAG: YaiO family outer membrane beta-barrel protein [Bacteroidetes bacterium]|jgi:YaiO family outer membrane protein|nr:YaiO family outer membrane beta-barrel protein [Bacteroidota bacterium]
MKYTEKSVDFQRVLVRWCLAVFGVGIVVPPVHAQDLLWPEPTAAPEAFVGTVVHMDNYERYYDPFRSVTFYAGDRRNSGTVFAKVALGQRGTTRGTQAEVEWYPVFGGGTYGYVAYAVGLADPFPRHRGGMEYFSSLPSAFEASVGFRAYAFRDRRTVMLLTGSAAKYLGNYWISIRPYVSVNLPNAALSVMASGRYYIGGRDEFIFLRFGAGFTPDERAGFSASGVPATEVFTLHSQSFGAGAQWFGWSGWLLTMEGVIGRQEVGFQRGTYVWSTSALLGLRYSLR